MEDADGIFGEKLKKRLETLVKKIRETGSTDRGTRERQTEARAYAYWRERDNCG